MPGILIQRDGIHVATIDLSGMDVVDVSVSGALDKNSKATLDAMGGNYGEGGCGHLIWISEQPLLSGEVLSVQLTESCESASQGKTIQELFPDEEPSTQTDFTINDEMAAEIRARPRQHEAFSVQVETSQGQQATAVSDDRNTSFTFRVLWEFTRPTQARVYLNTNCLDDVLARRTGTKHLDALLSFGDNASFILVC